jgi:mediator of RNA polymerase II transcription subunit 14
MDLITFTEDTSAQWHFIDMRLLFSPAPEIGANSRFQFFLKLQADNILAQKGLEGCFSFLHNLVLTHKIGILRSQAYELSRGGWFGALKVEPVRRSLVVQYWVDRPGKKNWIEIGVSSNKPKNGKISWRGPPISSLVVRWFRNGKEVKDVDFKFDFKNLSMERMLKKVIALHIGSVLRQTKDGLAPTLRYHTSLSEQEPSECSLEVSLGRLENKTTLCVEPRSGRYVLQPCTAISARAEHAINHSKDPATPPINIILTQMLAQTLQDSIQRHALQLGWKPHLRPGFRMDTMKQATKLDVLLYALYSPSGWTKKWVLAAVIDASGETWWFMELGGQGSTIEYAEQLKIEKAGPKPPINRTTLASIERIAVKQLAFCVNRRECQKLNLESAVRNEMGTQFSSQTQSASLSTMPLQGWSLYIQTSDLLRSKPGENAWLDPCIRVTSQGFSSDYVNVSHIASGTMVKSVSVDMQKLMSASPQSNFVFSENGNFAILLTTPFGEPIVDKLKARLRDVDRLRSFASILHKRKMRIRKSSLQQVQFQYGPDDRATVTFLPNDEMDVSFAPTNPHQRIRMFLREIINERPPFRTLDADQTGLDHFCTTLIVTRPLLAALTKLEEETAGNLDNPAFYPHSVTDYRLTYSNPKCEFNIQLRQKDDNVYWYIRPGPKSDDVNLKGHLQSPKPGHATWIESLKTALDGLFKESGKGWFGVGRGLVARVDGVNEALARLQKVVLACAMEGGWKEPSADTKTAAQAAQTAAPPQAQAPTQRNSAGAAVGTAVMAGTSSTARPASSSTANANGGGGSGSGASVPNLNSNSNPTANSSMRRNFPNVGRQGNGSSKQDVIELD